MPDGENTVIPAQPSFLAIYNPRLSSGEDSLEEQIVFYSSKAARSRSKSKGTSTDPASAADNGDDVNERLRQVGLAQGMVNFAKNFSNGKPVESVDTDKARIVLHELEPNWWILAGIDLTRLPVTNGSGSTSDASNVPRFEYSAREVYSAQSLIQQLRRAHSIFLLHHDVSLDSLYERVGRSTFCKFLSRFWARFLRNWVVLLNGHPAVEIFDGIKLAVGGELGVGVGEEEWGSGEREVLEDFISRTDGLIDLVVSRFGEPAPQKPSAEAGRGSTSSQWLGADQCPGPSDGVIFTGVGALSRPSVARVSQWMEWIYRYGEAAYGVGENPTSTRGRRRRRKPDVKQQASTQPDTNSRAEQATKSGRTSPGIPPPLVVASPPPKPEDTQPQVQGSKTEEPQSGADMFMKYLTLGYGTSWKFPSMVSSGRAESQAQDANKTTELSSSSTDETGRFLIGLRDDLEDEWSDEDSQELSSENRRSRTVVRTLHVELAGDQVASGKPRQQKLQVIIYIRRPFMFTFLFDPETPSLTQPSFYRIIHHMLGPLQKPLLSSTAPSNVHRRIGLSLNPQSLQVYDLVYDPANHTVRTSIPCIPDPQPTTPSSSLSQTTVPWSRLEALNVHHLLLRTYHDTRAHTRPYESERASKTTRGGWWVVWMRIPYPPDNDHPLPPREAFLVHRPSSSKSAHARATSTGSVGGSGGLRFLRDLSGASPSSPILGGIGLGVSSPMSRRMSTAAAENPIGSSRNAEGLALGLDARRYVEGLLTLSR